MVKGKSSKHPKWLTNVVGPFHAGKNKALGAAKIWVIINIRAVWTHVKQVGLNLAKMETDE